MSGIFRNAGSMVIMFLLVTTSVQAQSVPDPPSPRKAFALSMVLPGLGHRHANGGEWSAWGGAFAAADVGLWVSLFTGERHHDQLVGSYRTLASGSANVDVQGKDRSFYLLVASFSSSEDFREAMLQTRQWDRIDYAERPGYSWSWDSDEHFHEFRSLREDAESLRRRRSVIIASLIANRVISGLLSARNASRARRMSLSAGLGAPVGSRPVLRINVGF